MPSSMMKWAGSSPNAWANAAGTVRRQQARERMMSRRLGGTGRLEVEAPRPRHLPAEQTAGLLRRLSGAAAADDERPRRLDHGDRHLHGLVGVERQIVLAGAQVLPLRMHAVGAADVEPGQILERVVGVEAAAVLADLDQPRPDCLGGRAHRDGVRRRVQRVGDQLVAGERARHLVVRRAPAPQARQERERVGRAERLQSDRRQGDLVETPHSASASAPARR